MYKNGGIPSWIVDFHTFMKFMVLYRHNQTCYGSHPIYPTKKIYAWGLGPITSKKKPSFWKTKVCLARKWAAWLRLLGTKLKTTFSKWEAIKFSLVLFYLTMLWALADTFLACESHFLSFIYICHSPLILKFDPRWVGSILCNSISLAVTKYILKTLKKIL